MPANLFVLTTEDNDSPTKPITNLPSYVLSAMTSIERRAELAIERLTFDPDPHTIVEALSDLAKIRAIARSVTR